MPFTRNQDVQMKVVLKKDKVMKKALAVVASAERALAAVRELKAMDEAMAKEEGGYFDESEHVAAAEAIDSVRRYAEEKLVP